MNDLFDVRERTVFVSGASSGLGCHFATVLADRGARVVLAARRLEKCREFADAIKRSGGRASAVQLDVTSQESVERALNIAEEILGPIEVLVNNAGVAVTRSLLEHEEADWDRVMNTNLKGAWLMAQAAARRMVATGKGGDIINIASVLAFRVAKQVPSYLAAKAGLVHLTRAMAVELAPHGVRVNAIAPGYIETPLNHDFFASEAGRTVVKRIPERRIGTPSDLDGALLLLASDASRYINGSVITVDGGHSVNPL